MNIADPDQFVSSVANWSGSTLFAKTGYILVQQDQKRLPGNVFFVKSNPEEILGPVVQS